VDPGELVNFQGSPSLSSRLVHLCVQEVNQRHGACMNGQGAPDYTQNPKGSIQKLEAGTDDPRGIWRHIPLSRQG